MLNLKEKQLNIDLLNKYRCVKDIIKDNIKNFNINIKLKNIKELDHINLEFLSSVQLYHFIKIIVDKYNLSRKFNNNGTTIIISNADIKECINKIINNGNQKKLLKEHLLVFSYLDLLVESAKLISKGTEQKRNIQFSHIENEIWSYYINGLNINGTNYLLVFDVITRFDGENHYRVQRLEIQNKN